MEHAQRPRLTFEKTVATGSVPAVRCEDARESSVVGIEQGAADVGDVHDPDQAGVVDDRQVPEMPGRHELGRLADAARRVDDGRVRGHYGKDPDVVGVFAVGHHVGDVGVGDDPG